MHADRRDGVWPHVIGHADLKVIGAWWSVLLDDEKTRSLVQDKIAERKSTRTQPLFKMDIGKTAF